jgi:general secretion pathway protein I
MTSRERGFTLIEVVVAFVLLALVLSVSFEIFSTGMARTADLDDRSRALVVAQSRLAITGAEEALKEGVTSGESDDRRFRWTVTVRRADDIACRAGRQAPVGRLRALSHRRARCVARRRFARACRGPRHALSPVRSPHEA